MADATRQRRPRHLNALDRVRDVDFPIVLRGYDRQTVDDYVAEIAQLVAELEATQLRESVVQRALDEVGEQTSGILQRAHEAAEEIAARSRAQAEGRIQRAEREAEITRRDADEYAEQVVVDTKRLWEERKRLLEEIRQLADEVLATADDALERVKEPEMLRRKREAAEAQAGHPLDADLLDERPNAGEPGAMTGPADDDELFGEDEGTLAADDEAELLEEEDTERAAGELVGEDEEFLAPGEDPAAGESSEGEDQATAEFNPFPPPDRPEPAP